MNRKRTSLDTILQPEGGKQSALNVVAPVTTEPEERKIAKRPIKQQTVYLPIEVYEQLRRLAFEERVKMHTLLMEGLDRVFLDRGLPSLEDIKNKPTA